MHDNQDENKKNQDADRGASPIGFLVVTRKTGEGIMINGNVHVLINKIKDGQVRLAIYAPKDIKIQRSAFADRGRKDKGSS